MIIPLKIKEGKVEEEILEHAFEGLNGIYIMQLTYAGKPKTIPECRAYYFALCDMVASESESFYTGKEIHNLLKGKVLPTIEGFKSTKSLDLDHWYIYIHRARQYFKEHLNFYL